METSFNYGGNRWSCAAYCGGRDGIINYYYLVTSILSVSNAQDINWWHIKTKP